MSNSRSQNFSVIQVLVINGKDIRGIMGYKTSGRQQRNDNVPLTVRYKDPLKTSCMSGYIFICMLLQIKWHK